MLEKVLKKVAPSASTYGLAHALESDYPKLQTLCRVHYTRRFHFGYLDELIAEVFGKNFQLGDPKNYKMARRLARSRIKMGTGYHLCCRLWLGLLLRRHQLGLFVKVQVINGGSTSLMSLITRLTPECPWGFAENGCPLGNCWGMVHPIARPVKDQDVYYQALATQHELADDNETLLLCT